MKLDISRIVVCPLSCSVLDRVRERCQFSDLGLLRSPDNFITLTNVTVNTPIDARKDLARLAEDAVNRVMLIA